MPLSRRRKIVIGLIISLVFSVIIVLSLLFRPPPEGMILMDSKDYSVATSIDNEGRVIGLTASPSTEFFVFTWSAEKGVTILKEDEFAGEFHQLEVNDLGQRIENVKENGKQYGYVIQKSGKRHRLSFLGGDRSHANAINNKGQVVGFVVMSMPWWEKWWNEAAYRLSLPQKYKFSAYGYGSSKAAIWTVPPESGE